LQKKQEIYYLYRKHYWSYYFSGRYLLNENSGY
jgi:hypothetical protein